MNPFNTNKKQKRRSLVITALIVSACLIAAAGWGTFRVLVNSQDISKLDQPLPATTVIYEANGKEASRINLGKIEAVGYTSLPSSFIDAIVAIEDKRFFEHKGMDIWGIGRALYTNLTSGKTKQGASTITQQLAKNVFLTHERTWSRKWNEVLLAKKIEEKYDKATIMEMYVNQIYFGEGAWGIKRAADAYFGKLPADLTVAESAMLAGLVKAPSVLTPFKNPEKAKERRNLVLQLMKDQDLIADSVYQKAVNEAITLRSPVSKEEKALKYPYYVDQIIREASAKYGLTENEVLHGGLRIYTALDTRMQQAAEKIYAQDELFPTSSADQLIQSGAVLVDPRDGGIRALIGGRGKQPFRGFNRAVQLKRQPGSTMKPIAVYTPAFEKGYRPTDTLLDEPVNYGGYQPKNAGGAYHGEVTIHDSIIHSYNIPAVRLLHEMGMDAGMDAVDRFGLKLTDGDRTLGLALGGLQDGVSPLEMAEAFGVFANDGTRMLAHSIIRIESADGEVLAEAGPQAGVKATAPEIARMITTELEGVVRDGTGKAALLADRAVAGKTGTTEMPGTGGEGAKDNWFVGYTPQLVGSVWLGYDHTDTSHYLTTSSKAAAALFQSLMSEALKDEPVLDFAKAPGLPTGKQSKKSGEPGSEQDKKKSKKEEKEKKKAEKEQSKREKQLEKEKKRQQKDNGEARDKAGKSERKKQDQKQDKEKD
ncbi:transglycosylase domain-containing protein [Paenibacillus nasutitermitis]|uniref:Penicillin-binding protein 2A n=1 Tax=Paenibacillus nasutitermitis TaxID=1652958 RepID=A0A917DSJ7_9BACL|nr:PBP1A family penicillin-binding protein [Paenibacillus nasutitermitis]GGD67048.1 penicillin-binding protein 2A [Paenibacillus nasutitermitis]